MPELLEQVLEAQGGRARLARIAEIDVRLRVGGPFWAAKGQPSLLAGELRVAASARRERISFTGTGGRRIEFDQTANTVSIDQGDGAEVLADPRASMAGYDVAHPWSALQTAYFISYASWTYLNEPWLLARDGVQAEEIEPWTEGGETWRRLQVTFPPELAVHSVVQTYYVDETFAQRRLDYAPVVNGDAPIAHCTSGHRRFGDLLIPVTRRVHRRLPDNTADRSTAFITLDLDHYRWTE